MGSYCQTCSHPDRAAIDRQLIQGVGYTEVARRYNLSMQSVRSHCHNHLSRQLQVAWGRKEMIESSELVQKLQEVLLNAEAIFQRNYAKGKDTIALKSLDSIRLTLELVCRISAYVCEARRAEALTQAPDFETFLEQEQKAQAERACDRLNEAELELYLRLVKKIEGLTNEVIVPDDKPDFSDITYDLNNEEYARDPNEPEPESDRTLIDYDKDFEDLPPKPRMRRTK